jgi:signal transduction histidine kinase
MSSPARNLLTRLLGETLTLLALAAVVAAVYGAIVIGLGRPPTGDERALLVLSAAAAAVAALLWGELRARVRELAQTLTGARRPSPETVAATFRSRLTRALPLDEILLQLVESLRESLVLDAAEVWTGSNGVLERSVADPELPPARQELTPDEESVVVRTGVGGTSWAQTWLPAVTAGREDSVLRVAAAASGGELLGLLVVSREPGGAQFAQPEEQALAEIARQVGVLLHTAQLDSALRATHDALRAQADELRASRARVVTAADNERRRIERDLHDGAQQRLVGLALSLRLVARRAEPATATAIEGCIEELMTALAELRELARGLHPAVLSERGLQPALEMLAARSAVPVVLEAELDGRLPSAHEAALYFVAAEALTNVAKYAGANTATLTLRGDGRWAEISVTDDGVGGARIERGSGLRGLTDRVEALGGRLTVTSAPGEGTTVSARVPMVADVPAAVSQLAGRE